MFAGLVFFSGLYTPKQYLDLKVRFMFLNFILNFHLEYTATNNINKLYLIPNAYLSVIINEALMKQVRFLAHFIINYLHLFY